MFCTVKTDEGNGGSASSLFQVTWHTFACSLRQVPIRSMQHALVANKKRLVQGCNITVALSRPKTWSARMFFAFYISFMWMLYGKAYMCALVKIAARY